MATLTAKEQKLLDDRLATFKAYKKHTDRQAQIIALGDKTTRTDDEVKRLKALLDIEQKALDLAESQKKLDKLAKAEKDRERQKFEHGTYQLGGLFRALLKENNPQFIQAFRQAVEHKKIKTTYTDNTPLYNEYEKFLTGGNGSNNAPIQSQSPQGTNILPHSQNG